MESKIWNQLSKVESGVKIKCQAWELTCLKTKMILHLIREIWNPLSVSKTQGNHKNDAPLQFEWHAHILLTVYPPLFD